VKRESWGRRQRAVCDDEIDRATTWDPSSPQHPKKFELVKEGEIHTRQNKPYVSAKLAAMKLKKRPSDLAERTAKVQPEVKPEVKPEVQPEAQPEAAVEQVKVRKFAQINKTHYKTLEK